MISDADETQIRVGDDDDNDRSSALGSETCLDIDSVGDLQRKWESSLVCYCSGNHHETWIEVPDSAI